MSRRQVMTSLVLIVAAFFLLRQIRSDAGLFPVHQEDLNPIRIYAYRDWQSTGVLLNSGDRVEIRAWGTWLYTPGEYHGPEGHARYRAPRFYPIPHVPGGILIGRIGMHGRPFVVGKRARFVADRAGILYLRINDDILSDNEGYVEVQIRVRRQTKNRATSP